MPTSRVGRAVVAGLPRCLFSRTRTSSWRRSFRAGSVRASEGFRASRSAAEVSPWCLMTVGNNPCFTRPFVPWLPVEFRNCRVGNSVSARLPVPFLPGPEFRFRRCRGSTAGGWFPVAVPDASRSVLLRLAGRFRATQSAAGRSVADRSCGGAVVHDDLRADRLHRQRVADAADEGRPSDPDLRCDHPPLPRRNDHRVLQPAGRGVVDAPPLESPSPSSRRVLSIKYRVARLSQPSPASPPVPIPISRLP